MSKHQAQRQAKRLRAVEARLDRQMRKLRAEMVHLYAALAPEPLDDMPAAEIERRTRPEARHA